MNSQRLLSGLHEVLAKELTSEVAKLKQKLKNMERQRDQWRARAGEYRDHAIRYQKALAEVRSDRTKA